MNPQDYWNKKHPEYSTKDWIRKTTIFAKQAIEHFPKQGQILELGCGQGQDSLFFAKSGYEVLATDFSESALDEAKKQITDEIKYKIGFQLLDLNYPLPFQSDSFEVVYSHLAVHYFGEVRTKALFDEIYSVLKPGGIFAILTNTIEDPEVASGKKLEEEFYEIGDIPKRYFSVESMRKFTSKFEPLLLDNQGETHKDDIKTLIRFVGRKSNS